MRILVSSENGFVKLGAGSTLDQVAGRLNTDTLRAGLSQLGWFVKVDSSRFDYDVFDRMGWEPKAVNYSPYRTIFWADGNDKVNTRYERADLRKFLDLGNDMEKKNLIIGSQEMVRTNSALGLTNDSNFVWNYLGAITRLPENPLGLNGNYSGYALAGVTLERNYQEYVVSTGYAGDAVPNCGLMGVYPAANGLALPAYYYVNHSAAPNDSIAGVANSSLNANVVTLGVDWRYWSNVSRILRTSIDFIQNNGGTVVPVELLAFNAVPAGNRVEINWLTASEFNSDRFEVERAGMTQSGSSDFERIATEKAAGKSQNEKHYGPVIDRNVTMGSTYVYRLKMIDLNGDWKYSNEVEVSLGGENLNWLGEIVPNPASGTAMVSYSISTAANVEFNLYDNAGKIVRNYSLGMVEAGSQNYPLDLSTVASGSYTLRLIANGQALSTQIRVVK